MKSSTSNYSYSFRYTFLKSVLVIVLWWVSYRPSSDTFNEPTLTTNSSFSVVVIENTVVLDRKPIWNHSEAYFQAKQNIKGNFRGLFIRTLHGLLCGINFQSLTKNLTKKSKLWQLWSLNRVEEVYCLWPLWVKFCRFYGY